jgi:4-amino-4-deoxy-L-arabinose transferase-like glycosyltransferase
MKTGVTMVNLRFPQENAISGNLEKTPVIRKRRRMMLIPAEGYSKMTKRTGWVGCIAAVLFLVQAVQIVLIIRGESLTWDEGDHMFAGYMMWKTADYGLNPEHPPLVKLMATLPTLGEKLWIPRLQKREFKAEAYLSGRDWLARNDGAAQRLVFRMRVVTIFLAFGLSLCVFLAAWEWFGPLAGVVALFLTVFDPNILAHSGLVTTDIGLSFFLIASIYTFYRYTTKPSLYRLLCTALAAGLLLATKHSGILLAPMLVLVAVYELWRAPQGNRSRELMHMLGALAAIVVFGVLILWAFYGYRYAARPAPLVLSTSLANYAAGLSPFNRNVVLWFARWHLLPESYLMGLVDVKRMAEFYPTFICGKVYAHGRWWYFPIVILIKTTLGMLALAALTCFAVVTGKLTKSREIMYLLIPGAVYLLVAMASGMNIGARHILPLYAMTAIFIGGGVAALTAKNRRWIGVCSVLILAHIVSALAVFPTDMAYANEAWGGPANLHKLLSDANVDWAQQLLHVRQWQDRHPQEECWFAYFAYPEIDPAVYGIHCHHLPTVDTAWLGGVGTVPPVLHGTVLISAGDLSGCEWPSGRLNPLRSFQSRKPDEVIDYGIFIYRGDFNVPEIASANLAQQASVLAADGRAEEALAAAQEAVRLDPSSLLAQMALGDTALKLGKKELARKAYITAISEVHTLAADAQVSYVSSLEAKLKKL